MSLLARLKKNSTVAEADVLSESKFFEENGVTRLPIPALNVALSGRLDGGLHSGLTIFAGPSKHFKTAFTMVMAKAYMDQNKDAVLLFYDSEFGSPQSYFQSFGIPLDRVLHTPISDIEMLKHDIMVQLNDVNRGDKLIIIVDSIGNLASKKEIDDAIDGKSVADMTRAKQLKSLFRMVTPYLTIKDLPMIVVGHVYQTLELYSKQVMSGGVGAVYSANSIFFIGRQQEKDKDNELSGYNFVINVEKSRTVKEKSKIPISVSFDGGISTWSGLLDMALESGHVVKPKNGWYAKVDMSSGEILEPNYREKDTNTKDFWLPLLKDPTFKKWVEDTYRLSQVKMIGEDAIAEEYDHAEL